MFSNTLPSLSFFFLNFVLNSPQASGTPVPPQAANSPSKSEARSIGDGGLKSWEIVIIVLGAVIAIILIGGIGGACEVMLHTKSKIKQSNAEADAKAESGGNKALELEPGYVEERLGGSDASTEVEVVDASRFSWQPEKMSTGEDATNERALSDTDTAGSSQTTLNESGKSSVNDKDGAIAQFETNENLPTTEKSDTGFQQSQTTDRALPWDGYAQPDPALSQFVIGDEEDAEYGEEKVTGHGHEESQSTEPVVMPNEADFQHESAETHHYEHQENWDHGNEAYQSNEHSEEGHGHAGDALAAAPVGAYSGEGYSPAVMPDEADYLAEYRQSQLYLQQEDDWQQYYGSSHGPSGVDGEQDVHQPRPDLGYF